MKKTRLLLCATILGFSIATLASNPADEVITFDEKDKLCINSRQWVEISKPTDLMKTRGVYTSVYHCGKKFFCSIADALHYSPTDPNENIIVTIGETGGVGTVTRKQSYSCDKKSGLNENDPTICAAGVEERITCAYYFQLFYEHHSSVD